MSKRESNIKKKIIRSFIGILILCMVGALTACKESTSTNSKIEDVKNSVEEAEILAYVKAVDVDKKIVILDKVEWLTSKDTKRLAELGKSPDDLPNGFYIYNEEEKNESYQYSDSLQVNIMEGNKSAPTNIESFADYINRYKVLCKIKLRDSKIIEINEQYVP